MPRYIGKTLIDRLINRFALSLTPGRSEQAQLENRVVPITDADELLRELLCTETTGIAVGATGLLTVYTVPNGKRLRLRALRAGLQTGTWTTNYFYFADPTGVDIPIKSFTGATLISAFPADLPGGLVLDAGYQIEINVDSFAVAGTAYVDVFGELEDAF